MSVITRAVKSSLDASADALKAAEEALAAAKIANIHLRAAYDAYCVSGYVPPFTTENKKEEKCKNCKCTQSSCLHGKPLTEFLISNQVGLRVMSDGDSWKEEQKKMIGTVQSVKNGNLMVRWDSNNTLASCTYLSKRKRSSKFIVYCKTQEPKNPPFVVTKVLSDNLFPSSLQLNDDRCSACKRMKCVNGNFLTSFNSSNIGTYVKHVEFHKNKVGKIINFDDGFVGIQWHGTNKVKRYMFLKCVGDDMAHFQFKMHCTKDANSTDEIKEDKNKPVDESTDESFDAIEEDPEFVMFSSPSAEIVNVEKDDSTGEFQFLYSCAPHLSEELAEVNAFNPEDEQVFSFSRCLTKTSFFHVHDAEEYQHRIIISVDQDILLYGVGLSLKSSPNKVIVTLQVQSDSVHGEWNKTVRNVVFRKDEVSVDSDVLQFPGPVQLSSKESYLVMLSFYGGESYLYRDGRETVTVVIDSQNKVQFKFSTYKDDEVTNVNGGVINKLFFRPP